MIDPYILIEYYTFNFKYKESGIFSLAISDQSLPLLGHALPAITPSFEADEASSNQQYASNNAK